MFQVLVSRNRQGKPRIGFPQQEKAALASGLRILRLREPSVGEREVQSGRQDDIILLCALGRVRDIDIAERVLPAQPFADLRHPAKIEGAAVVAGLQVLPGQVEGRMADVVGAGAGVLGIVDVDRKSVV